MIDADKRQAVFLLHHEGMGRNQIASQLRISRNTVRAIIEQKGHMPVRTRKDKIQVDRDLLQRLYQECDGYAQRVHEKLVEHEGLQIQYSTLTRLLRELGLRRSRERRCDSFGDEGSRMVRSINAANAWLNEIIHGARSLENLKTELGDSSELATLIDRVKNARLRERNKAATVLLRRRGTSNRIIARILHTAPVTTRGYFTIFSERGAEALFGCSTQRSTTLTDSESEKTRHILEILHEKPSVFGINRTSWTQRTLIQAYKKRYNETISRCAITRLLKNAGHGWRKARRVLMSPDPNYREKVELLLRTIRSLSASEMLFFLDEWGPVQVKRRGGKAYRDNNNIPRIPRHQTSRGTVSLVAALSATTNQMTWMFVTSKDTRAMMSLLEMLYNQSYDKSKLYVTWDAVSWHNSTALTEWLDQFNERSRAHNTGPIIELVPLPTSAQFLNVIEGVLSGMTRAVINNSDYTSEDEMKLAISRHFTERNEHFKDNPRRAGKKIWESDFFQDLDLDALRAGD